MRWLFAAQLGPFVLLAGAASLRGWSAARPVGI